MGEVNSGFTPENIADAEWLWSNINADHRRFHDLPTHHKAMICHTAQRFRADRITELEAAFRQTLEDYAAAVEAREALAVEVKAKDAVIAGLVEALEWYGEQTRLCRLIHGEGDAGRQALAADGGKRAQSALAKAKESRDV